jgi:hypothetical protein
MEGCTYPSHRTKNYYLAFFARHHHTARCCNHTRPTGREHGMSDREAQEHESHRTPYNPDRGLQRLPTAALRLSGIVPGILPIPLLYAVNMVIESIKFCSHVQSEVIFSVHSQCPSASWTHTCLIIPLRPRRDWHPLVYLENRNIYNDISNVQLATNAIHKK